MPSRYLCLSAAVWMAFVASGVRGEDKPDAAAPATVFKAEQPVKIDGILDEPAWKKAVPVRADYVYGKVGQFGESPRMVARYTWDDDYLYIGYETFDKNLIALGTGQEDGPLKSRWKRSEIHHPTKKVDIVEFFISFGDEHFFWEIHQNADNEFHDIWCACMDDTSPQSKSTLSRFGIYFGTEELIRDDEDAGKTSARAVHLKPKADGSPSTVNKEDDEDSGYTAELRLPWHGLGPPVSRESYTPVEVGGVKKNVHGPWKMEGQELLVLAVMQDGDLANRYHHSSSTFPGGSFFHKGVKHWPKYRLEK